MAERYKALESKCHEESLKVVRLAAENATLKQKVVNEESRFDNMVKFKDIVTRRLEKDLEEFRLAELNMKKTLSPTKVNDFLEERVPKNVKKSGTIKAKSGKPVSQNLQAYYDRGKTKNK